MVERRINLQRQGVLPIVLENQMVLSFDVHLLLTRTESNDKDCLFHLVCFPSIEVSGNIVDALWLLSFVLPMRFVSVARVRQIFVYEEKRKNYFACFSVESMRFVSFSCGKKKCTVEWVLRPNRERGQLRIDEQISLHVSRGSNQKGEEEEVDVFFRWKPTKILLPVI